VRQLVAFIFTLTVLPGVAQQVPFGDVVSEKITNYHRHTPTLATSGTPQAGAAEELAAHGFVTVIDLRRDEEENVDIASSARAMSAAGIAYVSLPLGKEWPRAELVAEFRSIYEDPARGPVLMNCRSGNRVAAVWAAYRLEQGVDYEQVLLEARTIGLSPKFEPALRKAAGIAEE
jgi:uncharacterized protein (TIGR01244 family)